MSSTPLLPPTTATQDALDSDLEATQASQASALAPKASSASYRHVALDLLRGFIVIVMALDHVNHQFVNETDTQEAFELWLGPFPSYKNNFWIYLSRASSHMCAPGFFLTMGIGMVVFAENRVNVEGWSWGRVFKHNLLRGAILFAIGRIINFPPSLATLVDIWRGREIPNGPSSPPTVFAHSWLSVFEVMEALALTMLVATPLLYIFQWISKRFSAKAAFYSGIGGFIAIFGVSNAVLYHYQTQVTDLHEVGDVFPLAGAPADTVGKVLVRFLLIPGAGPAAYITIAYPLIPWLGIAVLGFGIGHALLSNAKAAYSAMRWLGLIFALSFFVVRSFGGPVGNLRGWPRGDPGSGFIEYFAVCKYPPDFAFASLTLALNLGFIALFNTEAFVGGSGPRPIKDEPLEAGPRFLGQVKRAWFSFAAYASVPLLVFGRTPLFYYILHWFLIGVLAALSRLPEPPGGKYPMYGSALVWVCVVTIMFFVCRRFEVFKRGTSKESYWRLL